MVQASLVGVLRILLIIVLIYYGLKILGRYVFPYLLRNYVKKKEKEFRENYRQEQGFEDQSPQNEGEVRIKYNPGDKKKKKGKRNDSDEGEYVDFEEIE